MKRKATAPVWPFVTVVVALFVISVRAPREWESVAVQLPRLNSGGVGLASVALADTSPAVQPTVGALDGHPVTNNAATLRSEDVQPLANREPNHGRGHDGNEFDATSNPLDRFAVPQRVVEPGAPIARQYQPFIPTGEMRQASPPAVDDEPPVQVEPAITALRLPPADLPVSPELPQLHLHFLAPQRETRNLAHWPYPEALAVAIAELEQHPACTAWCGQVLNELAGLPAISGLASSAAKQAVQRLETCAADGAKLADSLDDLQVRSELRRAVYGLNRRTAIWGQVARVLDSPPAAGLVTARGVDHLPKVVQAAADELTSAPHADLWREYLLMDDAKEKLTGEQTADTESCRQLARQVLLRLDYAALTPRQRAFLQQPAIVSYVTELQHVAAEPVDYLQLLTQIEQYELSQSQQDASKLSNMQRMLRWSRDEQVLELGKQMESHYRNANFRITVSAELINRLLPEQEPMTERVNEVIMNTPTCGCSEVSAKLLVDLIPNEESWKLGLRAQGQVESETRASRGILTFYNTGVSHFETSKPVRMDGDGVRHAPADTRTRTTSRLTGLRTPFDSIPILSDVVRAVVIQQYEKRAPQAEAEASCLLSERTNERVDEEVASGIGKATEGFQQHVLTPLHELALYPTPLEMRTTTDQLIARYRLAGNGQMAAFTPRPSPPANAVFSVQLHESAFNNTFQQLGWNGQRKNVIEMYEDLAKRFQFEDVAIPEDTPDDIYIRFANENGIRFLFDEGRVTIRLAIAELSQGRKEWRNFYVQVHYQPAPDDPTVDLVRDQYVELIGRRLHFGDQIALRAIFSRVFAKSQPLDIISQRLINDPRLSGLELSQIQLDDGWLSLAITPAKSPEDGQRIAAAGEISARR